MVWQGRRGDPSPYADWREKLMPEDEFLGEASPTTVLRISVSRPSAALVEEREKDLKKWAKAFLAASPALLTAIVVMPYVPGGGVPVQTC